MHNIIEQCQGPGMICAAATYIESVHSNDFDFNVISNNHNINVSWFIFLQMSPVTAPQTFTILCGVASTHRVSNYACLR